MYIFFCLSHRDCWYLYTLNPLDRYVTGRVDVEPDQTIEILMTELDPDVMKLFTKMGVKDGREATKVKILQLFFCYGFILARFIFILLPSTKICYVSSLASTRLSRP